MQRCPYCAKPNQPSSSFCIHCGEPIDETPVLAASFDAAKNISSASADTRWLGRFFSSQRALEFAMGLAILLGILGFALYINIEQNAQREHYKRAQEAEQRKDYALALAEYSAAGSYRDTSSRSSMVQDLIAERDKAYTIGLQQRKELKWWQAARSLLRVEEIQPNFRDARSNLADVRRVNGVIFYKQTGNTSTGAAPGIFVAFADGGDPLALPRTGHDSTVLAVSPDSRWVAYDLHTSNAPTLPRALYLYDVASRAAYPLYVPGTYFLYPVVARFTADSQKLWLSVSGSDFSYRLPAPGSGMGALQPERTPAPASRTEHSILVRSITLRSTENVAAGNEVLITGAGTAEPRHVATELGVVDGAVFSSKGDLLLYRVCGEIDREGNYLCHLRLLDLTLSQLHPTTIASITVRGSDMQSWELSGEFTRDGRHVLVVEKLRENVAVQLYTLNSGDTWTLGDEASKALSQVVTEDSLVPLGVPGLSMWTGKNALGRWAGASALGEARAEWSQRYFGMSPWVASSPSDRYLLYVGGRKTPSGGAASIPTYSLFSTPFRARIPDDGSEATRPLFSTPLPPERWLSTVYMLPEGKTLLSTVPPKPTDVPGLYAYDLETGEHNMAVPGAVDLWRPGFYTLQPEVPRLQPEAEP
ncbi:MAG: zinc ribbon domain-containing protein [Chloroflexota bacterium]|nr:zinc ribbon domain-containing protein [Chloroflexota bacterium]